MSSSGIWRKLVSKLDSAGDAMVKSLAEKGPSTPLGGTIWKNKHLRLDRGHTSSTNGNVYYTDLQINAETDDATLKKFHQKNSTHHKLAVVPVDTTAIPTLDGFKNLVKTSMDGKK